MSDESSGTIPPEDQEPTRSIPPSSVPPQTIGNFRILQKLGEGGMGEVCEAEQQQPIRRRVALKFIKWGMDTNRSWPDSSRSVRLLRS